MSEFDREKEKGLISLAGSMAMIANIQVMSEIVSAAASFSSEEQHEVVAQTIDFICQSRPMIAQELVAAAKLIEGCEFVRERQINLTEELKYALVSAYGGSEEGLIDFLQIRRIFGAGHDCPEEFQSRCKAHAATMD